MTPRVGYDNLRTPWVYTGRMSGTNGPWCVYRQTPRGRRLEDRFDTEDAAQNFADFMNRQASRHQDLDRVRYGVAFEPSMGDATPSALLPPGND